MMMPQEVRRAAVLLGSREKLCDVIDKTGLQHDEVTLYFHSSYDHVREDLRIPVARNEFRRFLNHQLLSVDAELHKLGVDIMKEPKPFGEDQ